MYYCDEDLSRGWHADLEVNPSARVWVGVAVWSDTDIYELLRRIFHVDLGGRRH